MRMPSNLPTPEDGISPSRIIVSSARPSGASVAVGGVREVDSAGSVAVIWGPPRHLVGFSNLVVLDLIGSQLDLPTQAVILGGVSSVTRQTTPRLCSIASALDVIGEKWSLLVVRELIIGVRRFNDIAQDTRAPRELLTSPLPRLQELGGVQRRAGRGAAAPALLPAAPH